MAAGPILEIATKITSQTFCEKIVPYPTWGLFDNTDKRRGGGGQILPALYNSIISKDMDLKFGMLK